MMKNTLGRLILPLVKFCDFEIFRFSVYFNLANSWKISELEKMVPEWKVPPCGTNFPVVREVSTFIPTFGNQNLTRKKNFTHERGNMYDPNAMAGTLVASIVGHIPKEISRYTRYIVEHCASVDAFLFATHHRPSLLIEGGLEIPTKLVVKLTDKEINSAKLQKYRKFVDENFKEPVDGKFVDDTERILKLIGAQNVGPEEDDDDEDIEHENDQ